VTRAQVPGFYFCVRHDGVLAEVGWEKYASLNLLAWEVRLRQDAFACARESRVEPLNRLLGQSQWLDYQQDLANNLAKPALVPRARSSRRDRQCR
jgi:hypothetical protein